MLFRSSRLPLVAGTSASRRKATGKGRYPTGSCPHSHRSFSDRPTMASAVSYFHYSGLSDNIQSPPPTKLSQNKTPFLPWPPFSKSQFHENRQEYADLSANVKKAAPKGRKITPSAARGDVREYCYLFDFAYPFTAGSGSAPPSPPHGQPTRPFFT